MMWTILIWLYLFKMSDVSNANMSVFIQDVWCGQYYYDCIYLRCMMLAILIWLHLFKMSDVGNTNMIVFI